MVKINGTEVPTLVDTGSNITVISQEQFRKVTHNNKPEQVGGPCTAGGASGSPIHISGVYLLPMEVQGRTENFPVHICKNWRGYGVLGMDWMKYNKVIVDTEDNTIYFKDRQQQRGIGVLKTRKEVIIPSGSTMKITLSAKMEEEKRFSGRTLGIASIKSVMPGLEAEDALVYTDDNGNVNTLIHNCSVNEVRLERGRDLGKFYTVHKNKEHNLQHIDDILDELPLAAEPLDKRCTEKQRQALLEQANGKFAHLENNEKQKYIDLIVANYDVFSLNEEDLGDCKTVKHKIHLNDNTPSYKKQFPIPDAHYNEINRTVDIWLRSGVIKRANSEYNSAVFLVPKPPLKGQPEVKRWRLVVDYRHVNEKAFPANFRLPQIAECLSSIGRANPKVFCTLDLRSGYHQMSMHKDSKELTAFTIPGRGQFQFERCPFGLSSLPLSFSRLMTLVFRECDNTKIIHYLDDLLAMSSNHQEMRETLQMVFNRLRAHSLKLFLGKCDFARPEIEYLGWQIGAHGYRPTEDKLKAIKEAKPPANVKQVRQLLGLANYMRQYIPNYSSVVQPLSKLTCKDSTWEGGHLPQEAYKSFKALQKLFTNPPTLALAKGHGRYHLFVDASQGSEQKQEVGGIGAVLFQDQPEGRKVISYASKTLEKHEKNYSPFLLERFAMTWSIDHFRTQLLGRPFTVYTDHKPLEKLSSVHTKTLNRLQEQMLEFNFEVKYHPGAEQPADYLSRNAVYKINMIDKPLIDMPAKLIAELQGQDPLCKILIEYYNTKEMPKDKIKATYVKRYAENTTMKDGLLMKILNRTGIKRALIVCPASIQAELVNQSHTALWSGHQGVSKTAERILLEYWFPGIFVDCENFVKECRSCQFADRKTPIKAPLGEPLAIEAAPLEMLNIDLFGPLSVSDGKKFVLVCADNATRFCEFIAVESKKPEVVAEALYTHYFCRYGIPLTICSDRGTEFNNKLTKELCTWLKIDKRMTTPFHAASNSLAEVKMKHIASYLRTALEQQNVLEWEKLLPTLQMAYNSSVNKATKMTPFVLLYGVHPRSTMFDANLPDRVYYGEDYVSDLKRRTELARQAAKQNGLLYRQKYTEKYNEGATVYNKLKEGDLVLLHRPELPKVNPKICSVWDGPYVILSLVGLQNALVQHITSQKTRYIHVNRLKPYVHRSGETVRAFEAGKAAAATSSGEKSAAEQPKRPVFGAGPETNEFEDIEGEWLPKAGQNAFPQPILIPKNEENNGALDQDNESAEDAIAHASGKEGEGSSDERGNATSDVDRESQTSGRTRDSRTDSDSRSFHPQPQRPRPSPASTIQVRPQIHDQPQAAKPRGAVKRIIRGAKSVVSHLSEDLYETIITGSPPEIQPPSAAFAPTAGRTTRDRAKKEGVTIENDPLPHRPLEYRGRGRGRGGIGRGRGDERGRGRGGHP